MTTAIPSIVSIQQRWVRIVILSALVLLGFPSVLHADDIATIMPDGRPRTFPAVIVERMVKDPGGRTTLVVRFPDGQNHPIELSRISSIQFGNPGSPGRAYNITVGDSSRQFPFASSILYSFANGQFEAQPPGESERYFMRPDNVLSMELTTPLPPPSNAAGQPPPRPPDGPPEAAPPRQEPDDFTPADFRDPGPGATESDSGGSVSGPISSTTTTVPGSLPPEFYKVFGQALGIIIASLTLLFMSLVTWLWLVIYNFQKGQTGSGVILIVLCWCLLAQAYYGSKYDGAYKGLLQTLILIEILGNIALRIIGHSWKP